MNPRAGQGPPAPQRAGSSSATSPWYKDWVKVGVVAGVTAAVAGVAGGIIAYAAATGGLGGVKPSGSSSSTEDAGPGTTPPSSSTTSPSTAPTAVPYDLRRSLPTTNEVRKLTKMSFSESGSIKSGGDCAGKVPIPSVASESILFTHSFISENNFLGIQVSTVSDSKAAESAMSHVPEWIECSGYEIGSGATLAPADGIIRFSQYGDKSRGMGGIPTGKEEPMDGAWATSGKCVIVLMMGSITANQSETVDAVAKNTLQKAKAIPNACS